MTGSFLIAARRSPVAPRGGALAALSLQDLAKPVLDAVLHDAKLAPEQIGELIVSNALGAGGNPARVLSLAAGWPERIAGLSIDRQCVGGLDALCLADAMIRAGLQDVVVAGGVESYSRRPLRSRTFADGRAPEPYDQAPFTPWPDRDPDMATAADALGQNLGISKESQDLWAIDSHAKARRSLHPEIVAVADLGTDSFARDLSLRHCTRAPAVSGDISAANMAVAADGASFVVMVSERIARVFDGPLVRFVSGATLGGAPDLPGLAPIAASKTALQTAGLGVADLSSVEIMEAFAVQAIACQQGLGVTPEFVNPRGGALARGHPIGASGAILAARLFHDLQATGGYGLATIAAAGGLGTAVVLATAPH